MSMERMTAEIMMVMKLDEKWVSGGKNRRLEVKDHGSGEVYIYVRISECSMMA